MPAPVRQRDRTTRAAVGASLIAMVLPGLSVPHRGC